MQPRLAGKTAALEAAIFGATARRAAGASDAVVKTDRVFDWNLPWVEDALPLFPRQRGETITFRKSSAPSWIKVCPVTPVLTVQRMAHSVDLDLVHTRRGTATARRGTLLPGDLVAYLPPGSLLPDSLLKQLGLWDHRSGHGTLRGPDHNRVSSRKVRGVYVHGMLLAGRMHKSGWNDTTTVRLIHQDKAQGLNATDFQEDDCAAAFLEVTRAG